MSNARTNSHILRYKGPFKVITTLITIWSFLFTTVGNDLFLLKAWADTVSPELTQRSAGTPSELTGVGSDRAGRPSASFKELNVATFTIPKYLGTIRDSWQKDIPKNESTDAMRNTRYAIQGQIVIHIQDAHCNYAAQHKIADIIEYLTNEYGINTIDMEGGKGKYDLSIYAGIRDKDIREKVSDYFVKEGLVSGPEYFAINNPGKVKLWGVEDTKLYIKNLDVYKRSLEHKKEVDEYFKALDHIIENLKRHIYNEELRELDLKYSAYKNGELDFRAYLSYLTRKAALKAIDIKKFSNIYLLLQSLLLEKEIDFKIANIERDSLLEVLGKMLSKDSVGELVRKTMEFKADRLSQNDYYTYLVKKANRMGVDLQGYPQLHKYIVYISTYESVDKAKTMDELAMLESELKESIFENADQRILAALSKNLVLTKNIFGISISREDYKYYRQNEGSFDIKNYVDFIGRKAPFYKISAVLPDGIVRLDRYRKDISEFYKYSFERDQAFLKNITAESAIVLVTGGFHTENLCDLFRQEGISYISIMPNFKNDDACENYYFRLLGGDMSVSGNAVYSGLVSVMPSLMAVAAPSTVLGREVWGQIKINAYDGWVGLKAIALRDDWDITRVTGIDKKDDEHLNVTLADTDVPIIVSINDLSQNADDSSGTRLADKDTGDGAVKGAMHEGEKRFDALRRLLRIKGIDIVEEAGKAEKAMTTQDRDKIKDALSALGLSEKEQESMLPKIIVGDVPDGIRLRGRTSRIGGVLIRMDGRIKILFPRDALEGTENLGDLLHELVEVDLVENGMSFEEAHYQAMRVREAWVSGGRESVSVIMKELNDPHRLGRFERDFEENIRESLGRSGLRESEIKELNANSVQKILEEFIQILEAKGWYVSDNFKDLFTRTLQAMFTQKNIERFQTQAGHFDMKDLILSLQRIHTILADKHRFGVTDEAMLSWPLFDAVSNMPVSNAEKFELLGKSYLAGEAWENVTPDREVLELLRQGDAISVMQRFVKSRPISEGLAELKAICVFFNIDIRSMEGNFILNLVMAVQNGKKEFIERMDDGTRQGVSVRIANDVVKNGLFRILFVYHLRERLGLRNIKGFIAKGYDGIVLRAEGQNGEDVVLKINLNRQDVSEMVQDLNRITAVTDTHNGFAHNLNLAQITFPDGDKSVIEINEFVKGPTLKDLINNMDFWDMSPAEVIELLINCLEADNFFLEHCDAMNVDILNMGNVIVTDGIHPKLVDFGNIITRENLDWEGALKEHRQKVILLVIRALYGQMLHSLEEGDGQFLSEIFVRRFGADQGNTDKLIFDVLLEAWNSDSVGLDDLLGRLRDVLAKLRENDGFSDGIVGAMHGAVTASSVSPNEEGVILGQEADKAFNELLAEFKETEEYNKRALADIMIREHKKETLEYCEDVVMNWKERPQADIDAALLILSCFGIYPADIKDELLPHLADMVESELDERGGIGYEAAHLISTLGPRGNEYAKRLITRYGLRLNVVYTIGTSPDREIGEMLLSGINSPDINIRLRVAETLMGLRRPEALSMVMDIVNSWVMNNSGIKDKTYFELTSRDAQGFFIFYILKDHLADLGALVASSTPETRERFAGMVEGILTLLDEVNSEIDLSDKIFCISLLGMISSERSARALLARYEKNKANRQFGDDKKNAKVEYMESVIGRALISVGELSVPLIAKSPDIDEHLIGVLAAIGSDDALNILLNEHNKAKDFSKNYVIEMAIRDQCGVRAVPFLLRAFEENVLDEKTICTLFHYLHFGETIPVLTKALVEEGISDTRRKNVLYAMVGIPREEFQRVLRQDPAVYKKLTDFLAPYLDQKKAGSYAVFSLVSHVAKESDLPGLIEKARKPGCPVWVKIAALSVSREVSNDVGIQYIIESVLEEGMTADILTLKDLQAVSASGKLEEYLERNEAVRGKLIARLREDIKSVPETQSGNNVWDPWLIRLDTLGSIGNGQDIRYMTDEFFDRFNKRRDSAFPFLNAILNSSERARKLFFQDRATASLVELILRNEVLTSDNDLEGYAAANHLRTFVQAREFTQYPGNKDATISPAKVFFDLEKIADSLMAIKEYIQQHPETGYDELAGVGLEPLQGVNDHAARANVQLAIVNYMKRHRMIQKVIKVFPAKQIGKQTFKGVSYPSYLFVRQDKRTHNAASMKYFMDTLGFLPQWSLFVFLPDTVHIILDANSYERMEYRTANRIGANSEDDGFANLSRTQRAEYHRSAGVARTLHEETLGGVKLVGMITLGREYEDYATVETVLLHEWQHVFYEGYANQKIRKKTLTANLRLKSITEGVKWYEEISDSKWDAMVSNLKIIMLEDFQDEMLAKITSNDWGDAVERWFNYYEDHYRRNNKFMHYIPSTLRPDDGERLMREAFEATKRLIESFNPDILRVIDLKTRLYAEQEGMQADKAKERAGVWMAHFLHAVPANTFGTLRRYAGILEHRLNSSRPDTRQEMTINALKAADARGIPIRTLVVVDGVSEKDLKNLEEDLNRGLYENGFGVEQSGARSGKSTHELLLVSGKKSYETTDDFKVRLENEISRARGYLPDNVKNRDRVVTIFAPQSVAASIREYAGSEHGNVVTVISDAYSDSNTGKPSPVFPDAMARYAIARQIFASTISESLKASALETINKMLREITEGNVTVESIEALLAIDFILRIKPIDWNGEITSWQDSQKAIATSL